MAYITLSDFTTATGFDTGSVNAVYLDFLLAQYSCQINSYLCTRFGNTGVKSKIYKIDSCHPYELLTGAWIKDTNFKVEIQSKAGETFTLLKENTDYTLIHSDVYIDDKNGDQIEPPIIGLDFRCLGCYCKCNQIKITGINSWSIELPCDIYFMLIKALEFALQSQALAQTDSAVSQIKQVKSERDITTTTVYETNTDLDDSFSGLGKNGITGVPEFLSILYKYKIDTTQLFAIV